MSQPSKRARLSHEATQFSVLGLEPGTQAQLLRWLLAVSEHRTEILADARRFLHRCCHDEGKEDACDEVPRNDRSDKDFLERRCPSCKRCYCSEHEEDLLQECANSGCSLSDARCCRACVDLACSECGDPLCSTCYLDAHGGSDVGMCAKCANEKGE